MICLALYRDLLLIFYATKKKKETTWYCAPAKCSKKQKPSIRQAHFLVW